MHNFRDPSALGNHEQLLVDKHIIPSQSVSVAPPSPWALVATLTAILASTATLPYLAVRRHLASLHRKVAEVGIANATLQRDLKAALLRSHSRRGEHDRLTLTIEDVRRNLKKFRTEETRKELTKAIEDERTRRVIEELVAEKDKTRAGLSHLRDLSPSLADIAAFMHEMEIRHGFAPRENDGRGIERLWQLAYRLQGISVNEPESNSPRTKLRDAPNQT